MVNNKGVEIRVSSNSNPARRDLAKLEKSLAGIQGTAQRVERAIAGIGAAITFAFGTDALSEASDTFVNLENRIALVTGRTKELNKTMKELYSISIRSRTGIDGTVETFNRFGRSIKGVSSDELLLAVENVQKAVAISGASAESSRAALTQLGQGLASGQLRGQELNSVMEQTPRLAQAIADSMGVPIGALRELAEQGQLTTEVIFEAIKSQGPALAKEFEITQGTVGQALVNLVDQFTRTIGLFDKYSVSIASLKYFFYDLTAAIDANVEVISSRAARVYNNLENSFYGISKVAKGMGAILAAVFKRFAAAIPAVLLPMRTLQDDIEAGFFYVFAEGFQELNQLIGGFAAKLGDLLGLNFEGAIFKLFQSKSLIEFGNNLTEIAHVVDRYGKRWYNVGNFIEVALRRTNFALLETGVYFGIVDQKLLRLRYLSFESFGKLIDVMKVVASATLQAIFALEQLPLLLTLDKIFNQAVRRGIEAFFNLFKTGINSVSEGIDSLAEKISFGLVTEKTSDLVEKFGGAYGATFKKAIQYTDKLEGSWNKVMDTLNIQTSSFTPFVRAFNNMTDKASGFWDRLMQGIRSKASIFTKVKDYIVKMLKTINDAFYKLYDDVIQNSWWTDTMEGVWYKAQEWLPKTLNFISKFLDSVNRKFKDLGIKEIVVNLYTRVKANASDIAELVTDVATSVYEGLKFGFRKGFEALAFFYREITDTIPALGSSIAVGISAALLSVFSPALFMQIGSVFALGLTSQVGRELLDIVSSATISSNFFGQLGRGLGSGVGVFIDAIIRNIPNLVTAFIQFSKEFGKALVSELKSAFGIIPNLLSDATGGIFDTIFGGAAAVAGFSLLTRGFKTTVKDMGSIYEGVFGKKIGKKESILGSMIFGDGGIKGSRAKMISGVLGTLTLVESITGGFTEGGTLAELAISGGLLAYSLFGYEGVEAVIAQAKKAVKGVFTPYMSAVKAAQASAAGKSIKAGLFSSFNDFKAGNFKSAQAGIVKTFENTISRIEGQNGRLSTAFSKAFNVSLKPQAGGFDVLMRNMGLDPRMFEKHGEKAAKKFSRGSVRGLQAQKVAVAAAIAALFAGSASAATEAVKTANEAEGVFASLGSKIEQMINFVTDNIGAIVTTGLMGYAMFGSEGFYKLLGHIKLLFAFVGKNLTGMLSMFIGLGKKSGGGFTLSFLKTATQVVMKGFNGIFLTIARLVGPLILGVVANIGGFLLTALASLLSLPGLLIAGVVGFLGIWLFGEGDGLLDKLGNFFKALRSGITGVSEDARRIRKELKGAVEFDKVGDIDIGLQAQLDKIKLDSFDESALRELKKEIRASNRVFAANQDKFDELGSLTALEEAKTRAAIRSVEEAIDRLKVSDVQQGVGALAELFNIDKFNDALDAGMFDFFDKITEKDFPELFKLQAKARSEDATNEDVIEYFRALVDLTSQLNDEQKELFDSAGLGSFMNEIVKPVIDLADRGIEFVGADTFLNIAKVQRNLEDTGQLIAELEKGPGILSEWFMSEWDDIFGTNSFAKSEDALVFARNRKRLQEQELETLRRQLEIDSELAHVSKERRLELERVNNLIDSINTSAPNDDAKVEPLTEQVFFGNQVPYDQKKVGMLAENTEFLLKEAFRKSAAGQLYNQYLNSALEEGAELGLAEKATQKLLDEYIENAIADGITIDDFIDLGLSTSEAAYIINPLLAQFKTALENAMAGGEFRAEMSLTSFLPDRADLERSRLESLLGGFDTKPFLSDLGLTGDGNGISGPLFGEFSDLYANLKDLKTAVGKDVEQIKAETDALRISFIDSMVNMADSTSLLRYSLSLVDDPIDEDKLYAKDDKTRERIQELVTDLVVLKATMDAINSNPELYTEDFISDIVARVREGQKELTSLVGRPDKGVKTAFEKFVDRLSGAGFRTSLEQAAAFSGTIISKMQKPLRMIEAAQKKIVNASLKDVSAREKALEVIRQQQEEVFKILNAGNVGQRQDAFASFGLDADAIMYGEEAVAIQFELKRLNEELLLMEGDTSGIIAKRKEIEKLAERYERILSGTNAIQDAFSNSLKSNLSEVLKGTKTLEEGIHGVLDSLSSTIIDTVVNSFVEAFIEAAGLKHMFDGLFEGLLGSGGSLGESIGSAVKDGIASGATAASNAISTSGGSGFGQFFANLGAGFKDMFSGIGSWFTNLFGGLSSGGGGFFSSILGLFGIGAMYQGGVVPNMQYRAQGGVINPQVGKDSVPVMLTPGEYILPSKRTAELLKQDSNARNQQAVYNINVQGDVSRQTRAEIVRMIPQITQGVNMTNKERRMT